MYRVSPKVWVPIVGAAALIAVYLHVVPGRAPWTETRTLVVAVRAVPLGEATSTEFGIGFADIQLVQEDGTEIRTHLSTKRAVLHVDDPALVELLSVPVPTGHYRGLSIHLTSPELRNDWRGDSAPYAVSLYRDTVFLPTTYDVTQDTTTVVLLGLETLQALREQDGQQRYLPVIQAEVRTGAAVATDPSGLFSVEDGTIEASATYGMSWEGDMRQNYRASAAPIPATKDPRLEFTSEHSIIEEEPEPEPEEPSVDASSSTTTLPADEP